MVSIPQLISAENARWSSCQVHAGRTASFNQVALRLVAPGAKAVYTSIQQRTGVPWFVIAVIHEREASQNFNKSIAQGDSWRLRSTHVPKDRGPFSSFEDAAYDALANCAPKAARWTDWSPGGTLTLLEEYNGLGYANKGLPSPYIWAGTNQYVSGKYVSDGKFDPSAVDQQLGCAGLLLAMEAVDPTVRFGAVPDVHQTTSISPSRPAVPVVRSPVAPQGPSISHPASGSIGDMIARIFRAVFSHHT